MLTRIFLCLQEEEQVDEALDRGLEAVQLLHTEYSRLLAQLRSAREVRSDRTRVAFSVGTVFTHKKFGYRGKPTPEFPLDFLL